MSTSSATSTSAACSNSTTNIAPSPLSPSNPANLPASSSLTTGCNLPAALVAQPLLAVPLKTQRHRIRQPLNSLGGGFSPRVTRRKQRGLQPLKRRSLSPLATRDSLNPSPSPASTSSPLASSPCSPNRASSPSSTPIFVSLPKAKKSSPSAPTNTTGATSAVPPTSPKPPKT